MPLGRLHVTGVNAQALPNAFEQLHLLGDGRGRNPDAEGHRLLVSHRWFLSAVSSGDWSALLPALTPRRNSFENQCERSESTTTDDATERAENRRETNRLDVLPGDDA